MFILVSLRYHLSSNPRHVNITGQEHKLPEPHVFKVQAPIFLLASHQSLLSYSHAFATKKTPLGQILQAPKLLLKTTPRPFSLGPTWYTP